MKPIKLYKFNRRIIGYIYKDRLGQYIFNTGKPSDINCMAWTYDNLEDAIFTAEEYYINYTNRK